MTDSPAIRSTCSRRSAETNIPKSFHPSNDRANVREQSVAFCSEENAECSDHDDAALACNGTRIGIVGKQRRVKTLSQWNRRGLSPIEHFKEGRIGGYVYNLQPGCGPDFLRAD